MEALIGLSKEYKKLNSSTMMVFYGFVTSVCFSFIVQRAVRNDSELGQRSDEKQSATESSQESQSMKNQQQMKDTGTMTEDTTLNADQFIADLKTKIARMENHEVALSKRHVNNSQERKRLLSQLSSLLEEREGLKSTLSKRNQAIQGLTDKCKSLKEKLTKKRGEPYEESLENNVGEGALDAALLLNKDKKKKKKTKQRMHASTIHESKTEVHFSVIFLLEQQKDNRKQGCETKDNENEFAQVAMDFMKNRWMKESLAEIKEDNEMNELLRDCTVLKQFFRLNQKAIQNVYPDISEAGKKELRKMANKLFDKIPIEECYMRMNDVAMRSSVGERAEAQYYSNENSHSFRASGYNPTRPQVMAETHSAPGNGHWHYGSRNMHMRYEGEEEVQQCRFYEKNYYQQKETRGEVRKWSHKNVNAKCEFVRKDPSISAVGSVLGKNKMK